MAKPDLPEEILFEIFLRVPAKSVGKCRCLSNIWNTHLSTKNFINSHITRKNHKVEEKQLVVIRSESLYIVTIPLENDDVGVSREIDLVHKWRIVVGSCNGLVLLLGYGEDMFVVNPVTCKQVQIPNPDSSPDRIYGFGYDTSCDDYKVVTISHFYGSGHVYVYSLKKKCWKRVCSRPFYLNMPFLIMPFVNGAVHWFTYDNTHDSDHRIRIDAFHLASETFHQVPLPLKGLCQEFCYKALLVVVKGCLCVVDSFTRYADVWVMKQYAVVDSWVKVRFDMMGKNVKPVCAVIDCQNFLYASTDDRDCLVACHLKRKTIHGDLGTSRWSVFVESIISPEQENVVSSDV